MTKRICVYSGHTFNPSYASRAAGAAAGLMGAGWVPTEPVVGKPGYHECPGCGRELKARKHPTSQYLMMLPRHNKA